MVALSPVADSYPPAYPDAHRGFDGQATVFTLRRTGRRPLRFHGWQLVEASNFVDGARVWHEINIFQTQAGSTVTELVVRRAGLDERDVNRVEVHATLEDAAAWLEGQDPSADIPLGITVDGSEGLSAATVQLVALRLIGSRVERDYRALVSDVLFALGVVDTTDAPHAAPTLAGAAE